MYFIFFDVVAAKSMEISPVKCWNDGTIERSVVEMMDRFNWMFGVRYRLSDFYMLWVGIVKSFSYYLLA